MRDEDPKKPEAKSLEKQQTVKPATQLLGLSLSEITSKIRKGKVESVTEGLLVVDVSPKSEAAEKNIMVGDVILSINGTPVNSVEDFVQSLGEIRAGEALSLVIRDENSERMVTIR